MKQFMKLLYSLSAFLSMCKTESEDFPTLVYADNVMV